MLVSEDWKDYRLIDAGDGEKLERWGGYILRRPDPQAIWPRRRDCVIWDKPDAHYHRSRSGGGAWEFKRKIPKRWRIKYENLSFYVEPTGFKHTGLFPEQAVNWHWLIARIKQRPRPFRVLNLFAYTGGATVAAAYGGAEVCHVDAAKGMVQRARDNLALSGLSEMPVRFIAEDVIKFVQREERRGRRYEGIIMDPPSYGRGPSGEVWKMEDRFYELVELCAGVMAPKPDFFLVNSYTTGLAPSVLGNMLKLAVGDRYGGCILADELGLKASASDIVLPCGASGRWERGENK